MLPPLAGEGFPTTWGQNGRRLHCRLRLTRAQQQSPQQQLSSITYMCCIKAILLVDGVSSLPLSKLNTAGCCLSSSESSASSQIFTQGRVRRSHIFNKKYVQVHLLYISYSRITYVEDSPNARPSQQQYIVSSYTGGGEECYTYLVFAAYFCVDPRRN